MTGLQLLAFQKAQERNLDPTFVNRIIKQESAWNPAAKSPVGALGLMQVMPATGRGLGFEPTQLLDPVANIDAGTKYLAQLRNRYAGDPDARYKMAAAYNAGPGRVPRGLPFASFFSRLPKETRNYVQKVVGPVEGSAATTAPAMTRQIARAPRPLFAMPSVSSAFLQEPEPEPQQDLYSTLFNYVFGNDPQQSAFPELEIDPVMLALRSFQV